MFDHELGDSEYDSAIISGIRIRYREQRVGTSGEFHTKTIRSRNNHTGNGSIHGAYSQTEDNPEGSRTV